MTVGELLSLFPADSTIQINIKTSPSSVVFIPDPGFYQENPKSVASVGKLPVTSLNIEIEDMGGQQIILLMINDTTQECSQAVD